MTAWASFRRSRMALAVALILPPLAWSNGGGALEAYDIAEALLRAVPGERRQDQRHGERHAGSTETCPGRHASLGNQ